MNKRNKGMLQVVQFLQALDSNTERGLELQIAPHVIIAIPAYNEERFIGSVVLQCLRYMDHVVVIDDGSQDATAAIAEQAGATVLSHVVNKGKSEGVNTALAWAREKEADALVFIDGDGQHKPSDIERVLAPVLSGEADMVVGSRFLGVKSTIPGYRKVGQHSFTAVTNIASAVSVTDSQSGFRAFSRRAIQTLHFNGTGLSVESEMQFAAREQALVVAEVPISVVYAEKAKRNPFAHGMQIASNILKLVGQHRPLFFFGLQGLLLVVTAVYMSFVTIDIFSRTHVLAVGYALIAALLLIIGILTLFTGVILHSVRNFFVDLKKTVQRNRAFNEK